MKKTTLLLCAVPCMALLAGLSSCTGEEYDLSDIDTHARIAVTNLNVPLNVEPIRLESMLDIQDGDRVRKETLPDGTVQYAIRESGSFQSEAFAVDCFSLMPFTAKSSSALTTFAASSVGIDNFQVDLPRHAYAFKVSQNDMSSDVRSISSLGLDAHLQMTIDLSTLLNICSSVEISGLKIQFMPGLTFSNLRVTDKNGGNAVKATYHNGEISVGRVPSNSQFVYVIRGDVERIDVAASGAEFVYSPNGSKFDLSADVQITGGTVEVLKKSGASFASKHLFETSMSFTTDRVVSFSGEISKAIDINVSENIDLSGLPDILSEAGTNVVLSNPELTLKINNPLVQKGYANAYVQAGLKLTGNRSYSLASDAIRLDKAMNTVVISSNPEVEDATHIRFDGLAKVLSSDGNTQGIPRSVQVEVSDVEMPAQTITDFLFGDDGQIAPVNGTWEFYTPLALTSNSSIKYTQTWTDWDTDDLEDFVITGAGVSLDITNVNVPLQVSSMSFKLNGLSGQLSGTTGESPAAGQTGTVQIDLTGQPLRQPTGATLEVYLKGGDAAVQPSQQLVVNKATLKLSGYYETEL